MSRRLLALPLLALWALPLVLGAGEAPALEILSPKPDVPVGKGSLVVSWRASGGDSVLVRASQDEGKTWKDLVSRPASEGLYLWDIDTLPEDKPVLLRLRLRDADGKTLAEADAAPFRPDRTSPVAKVVAPETTDSARVEAVVEASDGKGSGVASVTLWVSEDGKFWSMGAVSNDPSKPVSWTAPHRGRWGLIATASDRAGNVGGIPAVGAEPQLRVMVHTPEPWIVRFAAETTDYVVPPGYALPLAWTVEGDDLDKAPVTLEASKKGGGWAVVAEKLPAKGRFAWKVPAEGGSLPTLRLKAVGPRGEAVRELPPSILVDATPPQVSLKGPAVWEKPGAAELEVSAFDELSGMKEIALWWKDPDTGEWAELKKVRSGQTLTFPAPDGRYALWITASDSLGNVSAAPGPKDAPMLELMIDREPPAVSIVSPAGGESVASGRPLRVAWSAVDANLPDRSVALFFSRDGKASWELVQDSLPNDGELNWLLPSRPGPLWLRAVAVDAAGHRGEAILTRPVMLTSAVAEAPEPKPVPKPTPKPAPRVTPRTPPPPPPAPTPDEPEPVPAEPEVPTLGGLPHGGLLAGGKPLSLSWDAPESAAELMVRIAASFDGGKHWETVGDVLASEGGLKWRVPAVDCRDLRLRLSLLRGEKVLGSTETAPMRVASRPPRVSLVPPGGAD